jgi:hypothetical protein
MKIVLIGGSEPIGSKLVKGKALVLVPGSWIKYYKNWLDGHAAFKNPAGNIFACSRAEIEPRRPSSPAH